MFEIARGRDLTELEAERGPTVIRCAMRISLDFTTQRYLECYVVLYMVNVYIYVSYIR